MISEEVVVVSKQGLHARPAKQLVKECKKFSSKIYVCNGEKRINAKSILDVLESGISKGEKVTVECTGEDEEEACAMIVSKIKEGLGVI